MTTLQDLIAQKDSFEQQIAELTAKSRSDAVAKVKEVMAKHGLSLADLRGLTSSSRSGPNSALAGKKVQAKYHDLAGGHSWSGRGMEPKWLKEALASGKKLAEFAV